MKFLLDANLPKSLVSLLKKKYNVKCKRDSGHRSDDEIYRSIKKSGSVLITLDTDFLFILRYPPGNHPGIVVLRLRSQSRKKVTEVVINFCESCKNQWQLLQGHLIVVREDRFRIHHIVTKH